MKLAYSSTAFDASLRSGALTQLEWIDLCAHEFAADGVVFDVRHFPRIDTDYLAQVKKMAVDLGLSVAALWDGEFFEGDVARMEQTFATALALGAPIISAPLPGETTASWTAVQNRLGTATQLAKKDNVTIAVRNAPLTFAASVHDMKRVAKEADSAWLRYAPEFARFEAASEPQVLLPRAVLVWQQAQAQPQSAALALAEHRGFVALDCAAGDDTPDRAKSALRQWRRALFTVADRT